MGFKKTYLGIATALLTAMGTMVHAAEVELEYWVYSDFGAGKAGELQKTFIAEFEKANPGVKINLSAKGDGDLTSGQIAGAASGTLPDVFMNSTAVGSTLTAAGALKNIKAEWDAMPAEFRDQFNKDLIDVCTPKPDVMYCIPYTGFGSFMYRNLGVLEAAGIDPAEPVQTWDQWIAQMEKIKAAGKTAVPDMSLVWFSIVDIYSGLADASEWGADFENKKTLLNKEKYAQTLEMLAKMYPFSSGTSLWDQATNDLFASNELAFSLNGPWANPGYEAAAAENPDFKYDWVLVPGPEAGKQGGVKGYEMIGVAPGDNAGIAFKFAAYVAEKQQMIRWASALGRYNSNDAALGDPSVAGHPLLKITNAAVPYALFNKPPFFQGTYPSDYWQAMVDNASDVMEGKMTPMEGAEATIEALNEILEDG
uniref:ABC transporter substrate-binding protein n=1 Tax=Pararhizobium sp. IMCC3301 TaxID=3067904 RepID=UPI0027427976|nr:ABC transporter substrate-binding protein [Pararhizobium sp. IMCC3301]